MAILVIAPFQADLPTIADEVAGVVNNLPGARIVQGHDVDEEKILGVVEDLKRENVNVEGFWLVTHGGAEGALLSGNKFLPVTAIIQYAGILNPRWIFFNTCDSEAMVDEIQRWIDVDIIATTGPLNDTLAYRTARLFALAYSSLADTRLALAQAAPGGAGRLYRHWPSIRPVVRPQGSEPDEELLWKQLERSVNRLLLVVFGSGDLPNYKSLQAEVREVWVSVNALDQYRGTSSIEFRLMQERQRMLVFAVGFLLVGLVGLLISVVAIILLG